MELIDHLLRLGISFLVEAEIVVQAGPGGVDHDGPDGQVVHSQPFTRSQTASDVKRSASQYHGRSDHGGAMAGVLVSKSLFSRLAATRGSCRRSGLEACEKQQHECGNEAAKAGEWHGGKPRLSNKTPLAGHRRAPCVAWSLVAGEGQG